MKLPATTREAIIEAMAKFDATAAEGRRLRGKHKYAIRYEGRLYPVKEIIALATGVPRSGFSGGAHANRYLVKLGFEVIEYSGL